MHLSVIKVYSFLYNNNVPQILACFDTKSRVSYPHIKSPIGKFPDDNISGWHVMTQIFNGSSNGSVDSTCGSWSRSPMFKSHQSHWRCQDHDCSCAPEIPSSKTRSEKSHFRVSQWVLRLLTNVSMQ